MLILQVTERSEGTRSSYLQREPGKRTRSTAPSHDNLSSFKNNALLYSIKTTSLLQQIDCKPRFVFPIMNEKVFLRQAFFLGYRQLVGNVQQSQ